LWTLKKIKTILQQPITAKQRTQIMYLVQIVNQKVSDSWVKSPSVEKLQAFSFQLFSSGWTVIDCIPEKGALFEVHYGNNMGQPVDDESDSLHCVVLAPDSPRAMECLGILHNHKDSADHADIFMSLPDMCALLWHSTDCNANRFRVRNRP
jgi:hypothetical protein